MIRKDQFATVSYTENAVNARADAAPRGGEVCRVQMIECTWHQGRAGLHHNVGIEGTSAFLELCRQSPKAALQCAARAAMGALLQLIGEPLMIRSRLRPKGDPV